MAECRLTIEAQFAPGQFAQGAGAPTAGASFAAELRAALVHLAQRMAAAGAAPPHLRGMVWHVTDTAPLVGERAAIDLVYRDVFGGTRPPIAIRRMPAHESGGARVGVSAELAIPTAPPPAGPVYRGLDLATVARECSPRGAVPDPLGIFARWRRDGEEFRSRAGAQLDLPYGVAEAERFDLFRPAGRGKPPLIVFIHGGYWQAMDKSDHCQFVADLLEAGAAAAVVNYGLAPEVDIAGSVDQVRRCLAHLLDAADHYRFDPARVYLIGHSAGAHLAAMALAAGWNDAHAGRIAGALLVSGLYDLDPLSLMPTARLLGIAEPDAVRRLSPLLHDRIGAAPVTVAVGDAESTEFKRQSAGLAERWGTGSAIRSLTVAGAHHFSIIETLVGGALGEAAKALISAA